MMVFWDVTANKYQCFIGNCCLHLQCRNPWTLIPIYFISQRLQWWNTFCMC
jgi:hypothetical protein